jgi:hypothetical protein
MNLKRNMNLIGYMKHNNIGNIKFWKRKNIEDSTLFKIQQ